MHVKEIPAVAAGGAAGAVARLRLFLAVGVLGGFTTFSAFSLDVALLHARGEIGLMAVYGAASVICSVGAFFAGLYMIRRLFAPAL